MDAFNEVDTVILILQMPAILSAILALREIILLGIFKLIGKLSDSVKSEKITKLKLMLSIFVVLILYAGIVGGLRDNGGVVAVTVLFYIIGLAYISFANRSSYITLMLYNFYWLSLIIELAKQINVPLDAMLSWVVFIIVLYNIYSVIMQSIKLR